MLAEAEEGANKALASMNLDNLKPAAMDMSEGETDVVKRQRYEIELENGEHIWLTGNSLSDAFRKGLKKYGGGMPASKEPAPTLKEFVDQVYRPTFIQRLAPKTVDNYEGYLKLNILPFLGHRRMDEITVTTIQQFYDWMATASQRGRKKDLNAKSIERVSGLLGKIFRVAVEMKIISDSPIKKTLLQNPGQPAGHHQAISYADMDHIKREIPHLENERQRLYMVLLAYAGMRPEEILGLRWENVHLDAGYCDMVRTVTHVKVNGKEKTTVVREAGKTKTSVRTVLLPAPVIQILKNATCKEGYVLSGEKPLCYSTFKQTYQAAFEKLEFQGRCSNHDFFTTFGTELCGAGLFSKQVRDMVGHVDTRMVETVYIRTRHEGIMKHPDMLNQLNQAYAT